MAAPRQRKQATNTLQLMDTVSGKYLVIGPSGWCYLGDRKHSPWFIPETAQDGMSFKIANGKFRKSYLGVSVTGAIAAYDAKSKGCFEFVGNGLICKKGKYKGHKMTSKKDDFVYCWNSYANIFIRKVTKTEEEEKAMEIKRSQTKDDGTAYMARIPFLELYGRNEVFRACGDIRDYQFQEKNSLLDYLEEITFTDKEKFVGEAEQKAIEFCSAHPEYGLSKHEAGMISLYTAENMTGKDNFYSQLDGVISRRSNLVPWLDAIWLIDQGLHKLPEEKITGFRGINFRVDHIDDVAEGKVLVWSQFSGIFTNEETVDKLEKKTKLEIKTISGRNIKELSLSPREDAYVLPLGAELKVTSVEQEKRVPTKIIAIQQESDPLFSCSISEENITDFVGDKTATKWNLSWKAISDHECVAIGKILATNTTLHTLTLGGNKIGDTGISAIVDGMKSNSTLTTLSLYENTIGDVGTSMIGEELKTNSTLENLYLNQNKIGRTGAIAIAEGLKTNTKLQKLFLSSNEIENDGAKAIAEALEINKTIQLIWLAHNNIGEEGKEEIRTVKMVHPSLKNLAL